MEMFKLKIIIENTEIDLEGEGDLVHTIFKELRNEGLGALGVAAIKQYDDTANQKGTITDGNDSAESNMSNQKDSSSVQIENLPAIENVVLQATPSTESEWLLVYAIYCSNQGKSLFTRDDLRAKYTETNRLTETRNKNFASNIKSLVSNKYISAVNDSDFRLESAGLVKAKSILFQDSENKKTKKNKGSNNRKGASTSYNIIDLSLTESDRASFKTFWDEHNHSVNIDKAVLASFWIKNQKNVEDFTADIFFTLLRTIQESASFDLLAAIKNAKTLKNYFVSGSSAGAYKLHHIGEDQVKILELARNEDK